MHSDFRRDAPVSLDGCSSLATCAPTLCRHPSPCLPPKFRCLANARAHLVHRPSPSVTPRIHVRHEMWRGRYQSWICASAVATGRWQGDAELLGSAATAFAVFRLRLSDPVVRFYRWNEKKRKQPEGESFCWKIWVVATYRMQEGNRE